MIADGYLVIRNLAVGGDESRLYALPWPGQPGGDFHPLRQRQSYIVIR